MHSESFRGLFRFVAPLIIIQARLLKLNRLLNKPNTGLQPGKTDRGGASFDRIQEQFWVEYLEIFLSRNAAVALVVLEVIVSSPVLLERINTIAFPGAMPKRGMYPMREVS